MKGFLLKLLYIFILLEILSGAPGITQVNKKKALHKKNTPNILFIAVDDLRPELKCYGSKHILSPNIDKIAKRGFLFERAYCQQAVCSPSRTSLLTGLRPDATHIYDLFTHFRKTTPDVITLPQHFKNNGYQTQWFGKIYHAGLNDSVSWTIAGKTFENENNWRSYVLEESNIIADKNKGAGPPFEKADVQDDAYPDGKIANHGIEALKQFRTSGKPFFLALGFYKPHLPFNAPGKYWDMYNAADVKLPDHMYPPDNAPALASSGWGELRAYSGMPAKGELSKEQSINLIHGYRACISYTDAQIGRVMAALKATGLHKNTIVILWGDHGWKLGDYGQWAKHTNFEIDTRVPLLISFPGMKNKGSKTTSLVEFIDVYPSLCELAGLPKPTHLEGRSFVSLINKPSSIIKEAAFSQYPRGAKVMGYTMRTSRYRFTRWQSRDNPQEVVALELYDMQHDPKAFVNIANKPENKELITKLYKMMLDAGIGTQKT
ncbi:MAG: sulfatase [Segetibacter sp.]